MTAVQEASPHRALRLTPEQRAAVTAPLGPMLVVAGAGSGKTTVIAERMWWLVHEGGVAAEEILALTFTNKAAAHLAQKVLGRLGPGAGTRVSTYHGFGAALVADHLLQLGLHPRTQVLDRAQAWQLLYTVFDEFRFRLRSTLAPSILLDDALALASRCADHLVSVDALIDDCVDIVGRGRWTMAAKAAERAELCQVIAAYQERKRDRRLVDFGDQIALAVRLLVEHPEIAAGLRRQHPVVLLDEYQDTNFAQRRLLELIYQPALGSSGQPEAGGLGRSAGRAAPSITAVGDDMQSIYAFRGAHLANILHFDQHFPPARRFPLQTTFRFGSALAQLANRLQREVPDALPKELVPAPGVSHTEIHCFLAADDAEEASVIADDVAARGAPWSANAILCRKRRIIPALAAALEERGIPVAVLGASGLLERPEVVDLVSWMELADDPAAPIPMLRVLTGPRFGIAMSDLAALAAHARAMSEERSHPNERFPGSIAVVHQVNGLSEEGRDRLEVFRRELEEVVAEALHLPVVDLAESIMARNGLWRAAGDAGRENLLRFLELAQRFSPVEGDPGLAGFLEYLRLLDESEEEIAEARLSHDDAVAVMTIHQAKGLEFANVYVPGLAGARGSSRIFPDNRGGENPVTTGAALPWWLRDHDDMPDWETASSQKVLDTAIRERKRHEEWRLLYVACTRAQRRLVCSAAHWYPGSSDPQGPSPFYDFVAAQADLVTEWFRHDPASTDPDIAAKRGRWAAAQRYAEGVRSGGHEQGALVPVRVTPAPVKKAPAGLSVTDLTTYARCPKQFFWTVVRPLPRRSSTAARVGTEVHRWIERRADRQLVLLPAEASPARGLPEGEGASRDPARALQASFLSSPFATLDPDRVEAPFALALGRHRIRGRIDAVYRRDDFMELVDFKTGRPADVGDRSGGVQLDLYGLAAVTGWGVDPAGLRTTYCYLRTDGPPELRTTEWHHDKVAKVRAQLATMLDALAAARYGAQPGSWCGRCDFVSFCAPGRAWRDQSAGTTVSTARQKYQAATER